MPKTVQISAAVADVLSRSTIAGPSLVLPAGQLDRALYSDVDKVLKALGGKWNKSARAHVFADGVPDGLVTNALAAGEVVDQKKTLEQFYTPPALAARMCREVEVNSRDRALEPSAGRGAIVEQLLRCGAQVVAVEFDPRNVPALDDLQRVGGTLHIEQGDFLGMPVATIGGLPPTVVVMNPPFSRNQDIEHVERAFEMLAPGGRLAAIMSPHFTFAQDRASIAFRQLIGYPDMRGVTDPSQVVNPPSGSLVATASVEMLPAGTFKESGTNVSTVLVIIRKVCLS